MSAGRSILFGMALLAAMVLGAGTALAHATLVSTHPANGSLLDILPERIQLQFNEAVSVTSIRLVDSAGRLRSQIPAEARGAVVVVTLPQDLPQGTQTLSYRIVSQDGHPVGGVLTFSLGSVGRAGTDDPAATGRSQAIWALRALIYLCLLGGLGAALFQAWLAPPARTFRIIPVLAAGFAGLVLSVGLQGLDLLDEGWPALLSIEPWEAAILTSYGALAALASVALLLAASGLADPRPGRRRLHTGLGLLFVGGALAATGHASTAPPQWLMRPAVAVHVMAACFWAGALVPLLRLSRGPGQEAVPVLRRFSRMALVAVGLLIFTGLVLATVQVETPAALFETRYGNLLLAKLAVVAALLALASWNRLRLTPALAAGVPGTARRLRWSIGAEVGLMVLLAGVVAGWRFTPPPRNLAAELPPMIHLHGANAMVMMTLSPGRVGRNRARLDVLDGNYEPLAAREIEVTLSPADGSIEAQTVRAQRDQAGNWSIEGLHVPLPGIWTVRVGILVNDFERVELAAEQSFNR